MRADLSLLWLILPLFAVPSAALKVASAKVIEFTPQPYAVKNFYKGVSPVSFHIGGVRNLALNSTYDLASNAETQGLLTYATHKDIRLIYIITEVAYRLVANKASGIKSLADLRGKKVATMPFTSAQVFVDRLLGSAGLTSNDYTLVSRGMFCEKAPCGNGTFQHQLASGQIDAFGLWEPGVELAIESLGVDNAVIFQNASIYREVYSLYSTVQKLNNTETRKDIVSYVRALEQTRNVFSKTPQNSAVYDYVAEQMDMNASLVEAVWPVHKWTGRWGSDLIDFLVSEDEYWAQKTNRSITSRNELEAFLDDSILAEL